MSIADTGLHCPSHHVQRAPCGRDQRREGSWAGRASAHDLECAPRILDATFSPSFCRSGCEVCASSVFAAEYGSSWNIACSLQEKHKKLGRHAEGRGGDILMRRRWDLKKLENVKRERCGEDFPYAEDQLAKRRPPLPPYNLVSEQPRRHMWEELDPVPLQAMALNGGPARRHHQPRPSRTRAPQMSSFR